MKKINIDGTEYVIESDAQEVDYSGNVHGATNVKDALDALQHAVEIGGGAGDMSQYGYYGINFPKQMSLIKTVLDVDKNKPRLRFVHISDTHGSITGSAESLLENTAADFAVHTGDAVADKFSDDFDALKAKMLACTKPFYLTLGNHDCHLSPSLEARFTKYIQPLNEHNGLTGNTKTYYSVNYTKGSGSAVSKFKCIFLDQQDGGYDTTYGDTPTGWSTGKMTDEQIVWLIGELQEAATNDRHVLIFAHVQVGTTTRSTRTETEGWFDFNETGCTKLQDTLMSIVDAFINKTTYTYNNEEYTFSKNGVFVGWFFGHTHHDCYGRISGHESQFKCVTCRPYPNSDVYDGNFRSAYPHINYFTVDYHDRKLSLYRVGEQRTWQGTERVSFYIKY